jgi:hypothetical protein
MERESGVVVDCCAAVLLALLCLRSWAFTSGPSCSAWHGMYGVSGFVVECFLFCWESALHGRDIFQAFYLSFCLPFPFPSWLVLQTYTPCSLTPILIQLLTCKIKPAH